MTNHVTNIVVLGGPNEVPELETVLARHGCELLRVSSRAELFGALEHTPVDLVLLVLSKGHPERLNLLRSKGASGERELPPVVVLTDCFDVDLYVEAVQLGAFDGLGLPLDSKELVRVVGAAVAEGKSGTKVAAATA